MILTPEEREALGHRIAWRHKKSSDPNHSDTYTFNHACLMHFADAIEREVLRKLREAGPVAYKISHPHEPDLGFWFGEKDMTDFDYLSEPLFTLPEDQT